MKKRDKSIDDIFPVEMIQMARREARSKFEHIDYDSKFEILFNTFVSYEYQSDVQNQCKEEILRLFSSMIQEGYTPICVKFYQSIWEAIQEAQEK